MTSRAQSASVARAFRSSSAGPSWRHPLVMLRTLFRRPAPPAFFLRQPAAPSVVLACERCGFDYSVTRIDAGGGKSAVVWTCRCGSRFIPPGGIQASQIVRR